jgi:hypothetical protein
LPDLLDAASSVLVAPGDVAALARALPMAAALSRDDARARAVACCSHNRMTSQYENLYREVAA